LSSLQLASLVATLGWLALAIVSYSSCRLHWKKSVTMALIWAAIFIGVALLVALLQGAASTGEAIGLSL
jgi:hypothetical protein